MSVLVTFTDQQPAARFTLPPSAWTGARIDGRSQPTDDWVPQETVVFPDPDLDPSAPVARSVSTSLGAFETGEYRLVFTDAAGGEQALPAVQYPPPKVPWAPTTRQVATLVPYLTYQHDPDTELGDFTDETSPTRAQVLEIIDDACDEVLAAIPEASVPADQWPEAERLAKLNAAVMILSARGINTQENDSISRFSAAYLTGIGHFGHRGGTDSQRYLA